ncbi:MAG: acyltransferase [Clostridiales bacterium]|nr:acyltransferase [Clostridiales bacterium]
MQQFSFGKRETQLLKGIAIIAMFFHHFIGFPQWRTPDNPIILTYIGSIAIDEMLASFGKICVGIFAFISGYVLFIKQNEYSCFKSVIKRIVGFLIKYWGIFFVFLIYVFIMKEPFPSVGMFLQQCFGISTATGFDWAYFSTIHPVFAWYVSFYIMFLLISPLLARLCRRNFIVDSILISGILFGGYFILNRLIFKGSISTIQTLFSSFATWGHIGMLGYLFAKYNIYTVFHTFLSKHLRKGILLAASIFAIIAMVLLWNYTGIVWIYKMSGLSIFTPIFIYAVLTILNSISWKPLEFILTRLSEESTNMWFLHGIFFTPLKTCQWIAYLPKYPIFILIWTLLVMYAFSRILRFTARTAGNIFRRITTVKGNLQ